jgi:MoaA/NifB/PqqE/SkfB family radical SAM enzyme
VFLSSALFKRKIPMAVTIGVTTGCQCHCVHCSAKGRSKSMISNRLSHRFLPIKRSARFSLMVLHLLPSGRNL